MTEPKLGQLITEENVARDAIHVAVVPLIAEENMRKGQDFTLVEGSSTQAIPVFYNEKKVLGIVDPFLNTFEVRKGERFWGFLYPNTVTGMRHHWEHPNFPDTELVVKNEKEKAKEYLESFCFDYHIGFDSLIETLQCGGTICFGEDEYPYKGSYEYEQMIKHAEVYLGVKIDDDDVYFRCAC